MAGQPEKRSTLGHLLNVSMPFSTTEPVWRLICKGVSELNEEFNPDTDEQQFICEDVKTTILKTYAPSFEVSMGYQKDELIQYYFDVMSRRLPTGEKTNIEYIRFNKNNTIYGTINQFIGVKYKGNVYFNSVGGSGDEYLTSVMTISATGNPEVGYVSVTNTGDGATYTWNKANIEIPFVNLFRYTSGTTPVVKSIEDYYTHNFIEIPLGVGSFTVVGKGEKNHYVYLQSSAGLSNPSNYVSVSDSGDWSMDINVSGQGKQTIAFVQKDSTESNANESVSTQTFNINLPTSYVVPVPTVAQIDNHLASAVTAATTITGSSLIVTGSGRSGLKVRLKCEGADPLTTSEDATVSINGIWTMTISIPSGLSASSKTFSFAQVDDSTGTEKLSAYTQDYTATFTNQA